MTGISSGSVSGGSGSAASALESDPRRELLLFAVLTSLLSAFFYVLLLRAGTVQAGGGLVVLGMMWSPGAAALVCVAVFRASRGSIGLVRCPWRFVGVAYALPIVYALVGYVPLWTSGLAGFLDADAVSAMQRGLAGVGIAGLSERWVLPVYLLVVATAGVLLNLVAAFGEEIGWRGFLLPRLTRVMGDPRRAAWSTGLIWAVWHYPGILFTDYNRSGTGAFALVGFTILLVSIGLLMAWLRVCSGSVWPAAVLHASHNLFVQNVFDTLSGDTGPTRYLIGEFGVALAVAAALVTAIVLARRSPSFHRANAEDRLAGEGGGRG